MSLIGIVLVGLVVTGWLSANSEGAWWVTLGQILTLSSAGLASARVMGEGTLRSSFAGRASVLQVAVGIAVGAVSYSVSWLVVAGLRELVGAEDASSEQDLTYVVSTIVLAPCLEEWLCRGVLWEIARHAVSGRALIVVSAALFAILHGLNGAFLLEMPHRFVAGLLFGVLRARTGSLLPSVAAHLTHNALSTFAAGP
jgi:membrane protease YdiL (CAAX protease family)